VRSCIRSSLALISANAATLAESKSLCRHNAVLLASHRGAERESRFDFNTGAKGLEFGLFWCTYQVYVLPLIECVAAPSALPPSLYVGFFPRGRMHQARRGWRG
jgi:hypothetical protein